MEAFIAGIAGLLFLPYVFIAVAVLLCLSIAVVIDNADDGSGWGWSSLASIALFVYTWKFFGVDVATIKSMPLAIGIGAFVYLVLGTVWSFVKWYFKLSSIRDAYIDLKARYVENNKLSADFLKKPMDLNLCDSKEDRQNRDDQLEANERFGRHVQGYVKNYADVRFNDIAQDPSLITSKLIKPTANKHKSMITQWIAFWPMSLVWTIINDPVRKIVNFIFARIKGTFQRMSDKMFAGI